MSQDALGDGNGISPQDRGVQIVSLRDNLDDLLNTDNPFEFRPKLDALMEEPLPVLRLLVQQYPTEQNSMRREHIITVMGWTGENISHQPELTVEERQLLQQSVKDIDETIRTSKDLSQHMTASHALLRFQLKDEQYLNVLRSLSSDIFTALTAKNDTDGPVIERYKLRGYAFDNDLLENVIQRLNEHDANDEEFLKRMAEQDTSLEGPLRLRTIYSARRYLDIPIEQNTNPKSTQTPEVQTSSVRDLTPEKPLNYLVGVLYNRVPDAGVVIPDYDVEKLLNTTYIHEEEVADYQRDEGARRAISFKPGIVDQFKWKYSEYMLVDEHNRPMAVSKSEGGISYSRIFDYDHLGRLVKITEDSGFIHTVTHDITYSSETPDGNGHFPFTVKKSER